MELMQSYPWPGNVRELENVVERSVLLARDAVMTVEDLPPQFRGGKSMVVGPNQDLGSRNFAGRSGNSQGFRDPDSAHTRTSSHSVGGYSASSPHSSSDSDSSLDRGQLLRNHGRHPGGMVFGGHGLPSENLHHGGSGVARTSGYEARLGQVAARSDGQSDCATQEFGFHGQSLREALEGPERQIILEALRQHDWNRAATADTLQINRTTLYKKMKRLGLDDPRLQFAYS